MQKQYRLKRRASFAYVYKKGDRSTARNLLLLSARSREGLKIGLSVSKRVGNAVTRNRVKRLLREAINEIFDKIDRGYMYIIIAHPSIVGLPYKRVCDEVALVFSKSGRLKC